jgi:hypothetical protein
MRCIPRRISSLSKRLDFGHHRSKIAFKFREAIIFIDTETSDAIKQSALRLPFRQDANFELVGRYKCHLYVSAAALNRWRPAQMMFSDMALNVQKSSPSVLRQVIKKLEHINLRNLIDGTM